jgi:hypothetical protein
MALWRVKTAEKKNVFIRTTYLTPEEGIAAKKTFFMEEWYRWGSCLIRSDEAPTVAEDPYQSPLSLDDYEIEDQEADDGCSLVFSFPEYDNWTEAEKQYIEDLWESGEFYDQEFWVEEHETQYYGPLDVEQESDDEEEDEEPPTSPPAPTWPFSS